MIAYLSSWEMVHTYWLLAGLLVLGLGVVLFTVVFDSRSKDNDLVLAAMQAAKAAPAAPTLAEAAAARVTSRTIVGTIGELSGFLIGAGGLGIVLVTLFTVGYNMNLTQMKAALDGVSAEKVKVETDLGTATLETQKAAEEAKRIKAEADEALKLAKVPPPAVAAPIAKYDPATRKLVVESSPPDSTWFIQVSFKDGKSPAKGFVPTQIKDYEFKEGVPEFVSWYRQNGGRTEVGSVGNVTLVTPPPPPKK